MKPVLALVLWRALFGVAGGESLIPTIVLVYDPDIKMAGSLSLVVGPLTMIAGFAPCSQSDSFTVLKEEQSLFHWMEAGSIIGAALDGMMSGLFPTRLPMDLLAVIFPISAVQTFQHAH